jgi:hypothetical protein
MRATEFITESRVGKMHQTHQAGSPGAYGGHGMDKYYDLYRASMLMGLSPEDLADVDTSSWIASQPFIGTYTDVDLAKMQAALKALGIKPKTHISGPSEEHKEVNIQSPIKSFKGYPR